MSILLKSILILAAVSALSACGNPTSLGSGTESGGAATTEESITTSKKISKADSASATLQIPAGSVIAEALSTPEIDGATLREFVAAAVVEDYRKFGITSHKPFEILKQVGAGGTFKRQPELAPIMSVIAPYRGWQVSPIYGGRPMKGKERGNEELHTYLAFQEAAIDYANSIFTGIALKLNQEVEAYADPDAAREAVRREWDEIPEQVKANLWNAAVQKAFSHSRTLDTTNSGGVDWSTSDGSTYSGTQDGLTWTKAGVEWFGHGSLSGRKWTVAVESAYSRSMDKGTGTGQSLSGHTGEKATATAQPK